MENIDPAAAARVWQRVQQRPQELPGLQPSHLQGMIRQTWQDGAIFSQLAAKRGKSSQKLKQLARKSWEQLAALKGVYTMLTGESPQVLAPKLPKEPAEILLRRSYGQKLRKAADYEALSEEREYGAFFAQLARQEREQCRILLEIMGMA